MNPNPTQALQEVFNASELAPLTGPQRDHVRAQAQELNRWINERLAAEAQRDGEDKTTDKK